MLKPLENTITVPLYQGKTVHKTKPIILCVIMFIGVEMCFIFYDWIINMYLFLKRAPLFKIYGSRLVSLYTFGLLLILVSLQGFKLYVTLIRLSQHTHASLVWFLVNCGISSTSPPPIVWLSCFHQYHSPRRWCSALHVTYTVSMPPYVASFPRPLMPGIDTDAASQSCHFL